MKFKSFFILPTEDFKDSIRKELVVAMPDLEDLSDAYEIEYKVTIPDYLFNELADTEPQFTTKYDVNVRNISGCFSQKSVTHKWIFGISVHSKRMILVLI